MKPFFATLLLLLTASGTHAQEVWTLRRCIDHAVSHNLQIRRSDNQTKQQALEVNTARWARLPNLQAGAGQSWSWGRAASPVDNSYRNINSSNSNMNLGSSVPLFTGFELPNRERLSRLNLQLAFQELEKAKEDLSMQVASLYLQALFQLELSGVARGQVELSRHRYDRIQGLHTVGKASPAQVAEAKAHLAQEETTLTETEQAYRLALLELTQLLDLPSPEGFAIEPPQADYHPESLPLPDALFDVAVATRPAIKAAQLRCQAGKIQTRLAQSALYPQLSLNAGLSTGYYSVNGQNVETLSKQLKNNLNQYIGFSLSIPIFSRFGTRNRIRAARLQEVDLALQLDQDKQRLYKEIQQAYYNATAAQAKYASCQAAVEAGQASFDLMAQRLDSGTATFLEYSESQQNLARLLSNRLQAKYDYLFRRKMLLFYQGVPIE